MAIATDLARVLIVEDEAIAGLYLKSLVASMGHTVLAVVSTGRTAVEIATSEEIDLIIMDIKLADDVDGITAAEMIGRKIPIIFHSAYVDRLTLDRAMVVEPVAVLEKPTNDSVIRKAIELALTSHDT